MKEKIRWGILSTGNIAKKFVTGLKVVKDAEIVAVGSRTKGAAESFGNAFEIPRRHGSYEALVADPEVDVIYVGTPHPFHAENTLLCLRGGKAVLCEKPFSINAREAGEMIALARRKNLFLMEAMWTRYIPAIAKVRELIDAGAIGTLQMVQADFGYRARFDPKGRAFDPELGGGALLDVGVYPISLASMLLGAPSRVAGMAQMGSTGVDELSAVLLGYPKGQLALLASAVSAATAQETFLIGTGGHIWIHAPWYKSERLTVSRPEKKDEEFYLPLEGNGYNYEAIEVGRCLRAGRIESEIMPLDETLSIMKTMDQVREQWGLRYPDEK